MKRFHRIVGMRRNRSENPAGILEGWETQSREKKEDPWDPRDSDLWKSHSASDNGMTITSNFPT